MNWREITARKTAHRTSGMLPFPNGCFQRIRIRIFPVISLLYLIFSTGCSNISPAIHNPKGPAAERIWDLGLFMFILGSIVYLGVMAFLALGLFRRRREADPVNPRRDRVWITWSGVGVTVLILLIVFGLTVDVLGKVSTPGDPSDVSIRVTAQQFWWQIEYPGLGIVTANEIHIPVGQQVQLDLRSPDVIHSFWVPQLHGKRDVIPGKVNTFWIEASQPGDYWGECAEFCGAQHAKMQFVVVVETQEAFDAWVQRQQQDAQASENPYYQRGQEVFMQAGCAGCHRIAGTNAQGLSGPDLTHLGSRQTIAAGALENNKANLGGWVADPQGIKPGNRMPNLNIPADDFRTLIDYLTTLE